MKPNFPITKENQYNLVDIAEIANSLGVDVFALLFGIFTTHELIAKTDEITQSEFGFKTHFWHGFTLDRVGIDVKAIEEQIKHIKSRKWRFAYRQYPQDTKAFSINDHYNHPDKPHGKGLCIVPWFRMQVMPNGDVALCEDTPDYIVGNILDKEPLDIWNNEQFIEFRKYILENKIFPVCSRCSALYEIPHYANASI